MCSDVDLRPDISEITTGSRGCKYDKDPTNSCHILSLELMFSVYLPSARMRERAIVVNPQRACARGLQ